MSKTLAQIGYEAWHGELAGVNRAEEWSKEDQGRVMRWQAAAEAVAAEVCDPKVYELAKTLVGKWNAHLAIIKAAQAVLHSENWNQQDMVDDLNEATEAYEAVTKDQG